MFLRTRQVVTLASIVTMLLMQVPQVLAVCVCDMTACDRTCTHESTPVPAIEAPGTCCAARSDAREARCASDVAGEGAGSACGRASSDESGAAISKPCCAKELVISSEASTATLPVAGDDGKVRVVASAAEHSVVSHGPSPESHAVTGSLRAPPGALSPPIYLLHASFLI